ncbi:MAG TPA: AsmA family protein [Xanthobacteraceae bacterium]|nr:AsmA family protein [Xanthobacteraceae bacterium]
MTAAIGLKRLAIAVAAILAAAFVTLVALSILIPATSVRDAVNTEIRAVTGLEPILGDDISLSLFPSGAVTFHEVLLGDNRSGQPAVAADELTARLRYFPLLAGRIEIADVTLVRPTINVTFAADGQSNWSGLIDTLARALEPNPDHRMASFSEIGIQDGTVVVHDVGKNATERLENVEFQVAWPSISRSFGANGHFVWNDEPVEASLTLTDFLAALTGDRSGLKVRVSGAPLQLAFDGTASAQPTLKIEGALGVDAPSLRDAMRWTGSSKLPFGGFGRFTLRAQSDIGGGAVALSNVNVEVDGNAAEGALTLSTDGQRMVQGTLAADALDLTPYVSGVRLLARNERNWDALPIAFDGFSDFNLDLRLSAASIKLSTATLGRTAVAANLRNGKLDLTIGEAQTFGGIAKGTLGFNVANNGIGVSSHMQFVDVDLNDCLGQLFGVHKLEGHGNLAMNIDGSGASVMAVTHALNGTASLTAHSGAISGINVEQLLRRLQRRPLSGSGDFRTGSTPFDDLAISLKIDQGMVSIDDMHVDGPAVKLAVGGQASVPTRDLDLKGVATLVSNTSADGFDLPFVVQGPWDDPIMLPDPQALIRRSGAAAPLLDAAKTHNASDAVRSVIDQLLAQPSGSAPAPGIAPAATTAPPKPTQ